MTAHHFISYSPADAQEFILQLYDALLGGQPSIPVWCDQHDLPAGQDWDTQLLPHPPQPVVCHQSRQEF